MKLTKKIVNISILLSLLCTAPLFAANASNPTEGMGVDRYAVYVGSNNGGKGREQLLYAGSDAQNFKKIMAEIGGVQDSNSWILIDPTKEKITEAFDAITKKINDSQTKAKRSEFIFYYSGHSDENSLLLGDVSYDYSSLKAAITEVPSDIHIVILDSCYSGNFIRTKGGQKRKPFLMDDTAVVTGHAYLSSSSDDEYSQESDEIESSFFTNAMITGLRGAADTSGDNKVTLNELYTYAFNDTLSKTESSKAGPQHPNFNITLVGSGDLVLSDISNAESMLSLSKDSKGKFIIRNSEGKLISEIDKTEGQPIFMALPSGQYSAIIIDEYSTKQGYFILEKDQIYVLDQYSLSSIKRKSNRLRGNAEDSDDEDFEEEEVEESSGSDRSRRRYRNIYSAADVDSENSTAETVTITEVIEDDEDENLSREEFMNKSSEGGFNFFHFSVFPGVSIVGSNSNQYSLASLGIFGAFDKNVCSIQASSLMNITSGSVYGGQVAGLFNIAGTVNGIQGAGLFNINTRTNGAQTAGLFNITKSVNGIQGAGLFNISQNVNGVQAAGLFNFAKSVKGIQIGLINIAEENNGIAIGLFNFIQNGMHHLCFTWNTNDMFDIYYQSGTRKLFMTFGVSMNREDMFERAFKSTEVLYIGLGSEINFLYSSLDFEFLGKTVLNPYELPHTEEEAEAYNFDQYFIPSFRLTWNVISASHFDLSVGANFDIHRHGYNDRAFALTKNRAALTSNDATLYTSAFFGVKFK